MKPTNIAPVLTRKEFIEVLILEVLKCEDYLDEVDPRDVKIITRKNLLETLITLIINYETEK